MSAWIEVLGWSFIATGAWCTLTATRTLMGLHLFGKNQVLPPSLRRSAWQNVFSGPLTIAWGVFWVEYHSTHGAVIWLPVAYVAVWVIWAISSRFWFRNKNGKAAGQQP